MTAAGRRIDGPVGMVGAGAMGRGIAQVAAAAGLEVRLFDARPGAAEAGRDAVAEMFARLAGKARMDTSAANAAAARISPVGELAELAGVALVIEAIVEELAAKRQLFAALEPVVGQDCILATNTSSLSVAAIAAACRHPQRVAGLHFFNPAPLMKLAEVIGGARTDPAVVAALAELVERLGHRAVRAADTPGFIVNQAGRGFGTEALRILEESVASFDAIDRILRDAAGFRIGPFELFDLVGLDVSLPVMESVFAGFYGEPRFRPSYLLKHRVEAGLLGRKTKRGFYDDSQVERAEIATPEPPRGERRPVWVGAAEAEWREALLSLVEQAGWPVDAGERPDGGALCLVAPLGDDATTAALADGLDPARTVAIDMLFGLARRRTLMTPPGGDVAFAATAAALLGADGTPVSQIRDSPGFVAQRVLATIVNIACDMAQARIASPADIDDAARLGLGYPHGPLTWGDRLGPARILHILNAMLRQTGDPRYRASLWLSRRARLGLPLLTGE